MNDTPSSLGNLIDQRFELRNTRMAKAKEVDELKRQERVLEDEIQAAMKAAGDLRMAGGKLANVSINPITVASVSDWDKVFAYIKETGYFHLLQKRMSEPAYRELLGHDITVPGTEPTVLTKLSVTKVSKK
jgi:hypothetical protein